jgi:peptidoglycan/LPS O-acetylase OafA/YrhL
MTPTTPLPTSPPGTASATAGRDVALDGLRGLAALTVLVNHLGVENPGGYTAPKWLLWPFEGPAAVIIFFVLSGYVIGLTNPPNAERNIGLYLKRRALRLVPITWIGILLACAAMWPVPLWEVAANFFFLQSYAPYGAISIPVIAGNENLWSLNNEVLFYLLFVPLWLFARRLRPAFLVCAGLSVLGWFTPWVPIFVACYAVGFIFWLGGLALAWQTKPLAAENSNWPSCVLLLLVTWKVRVLVNLLVFLPIPQFEGPVIRFYNLEVLPACLWLVSLVARRELPYRKWFVALAVALPFVGLAIKWFRPGYFTPFDYRMALGGFVLALLLWRWRPSLQFFRRCAPVGLIAFALYATSRPIQVMLLSQAGGLRQNAPGYALCASAIFLISFFFAWVLERKFQPWLNRVFASPRHR